MTQVVCISDTHNRHERVRVPDGDILIHAGDFTVWGEEQEIRDFNDWLGTLDHPHKILISGNHEFMFEQLPEVARPLITNATYLEDSEVRIDGLRIYGAPWNPRYGDLAFNVSRGPALAEKWAGIPDGVDILVTHGPPAGFGDQMKGVYHVGDVDLLEAIRLRKPRLHVCGHIHSGYGRREDGGTLFVNAAVCDNGYRVVNDPIVVKL